jgi:hypothetical protein
MDVSTILVALAVVALLAVVGLFAWRTLHRRSLQQRFGPEYAHTVESAGSRRAAERELDGRLRDHKKVQLRDPSVSEKRDLATRWNGIQVDFVDHPQDAVETADKLVAEAMRLRGYPEGNFEQRVAGASVEHPQLASDYREARRLAELNRRGGATTEDMRQSMIAYRSIFQALLGVDLVPSADVSATAAATAVPPRSNVRH